MKSTITSIIFVCLCICANAQPQQFAVVRPNGVTTICPSIDSAYSVAVDDDFIYLPGGEIQIQGGSFTIDKRLHIYGAGHHPDSSATTFKTVLNAVVSVLAGASGGAIEGVQINSNLTLGGVGVNRLQNYTIKRCVTGAVIFTSPHIDSLPEFLNIAESVISQLYCNFNPGAKNNLFLKNIIMNSVVQFQYCIFKNNILLYSSGNFLFDNVSYSLIENNVICRWSNIDNGCTNSYFNNLKVLSTPISDCSAEEGTIYVDDVPDIFMDYGGSGSFQYFYDFHLDPNCPGNDAGTDGTDVGIYGTNNPTPEGWVPSNPHIYFKQVDPETGSDGRLHIQVGVRTNDD